MKRILSNIAQLIVLALALSFSNSTAYGFALLGPYEDWMQPSNDFRLPVDAFYNYPEIGGPMCISNGYRWNVPCVTYGFDSSFIQFFGSNGVAAVERAIQTINDVPPSSKVVLTNYPDSTQQPSGSAHVGDLVDLQSQTLALLLERLGLASPTRSIFVLRQYYLSYVPQYDWPPGYVLMRNYDPYLIQPSEYVNGLRFAGQAQSLSSVGFNIATIIPIPEDLNIPTFFYPTVADNELQFGNVYAGLTFDDVGGLAFLYSTNNINFENLLPDVKGDGTNLNHWIDGAWRPGVDKVTFVRHPFNAATGRFSSFTTRYTDTYYSNGVAIHQRLQRTIPQPDILFSCADINTNYPSLFSYRRTGTSNWINNAALNGRPLAGGPGVITPSATITFDTAGHASIEDMQDSPGIFDISVNWATFDATASAPFVYPVPRSGTIEQPVRVWLQNLGIQLYPTGPHVDLMAKGTNGQQFVLQSSTNFTCWTDLDTNQIDASVWSYFLVYHDENARYFRVIPK